MKRLLSATFALVLLCSVMSAQPRAIGLRMGGTCDFSYQHCFHSDNFLEADLGINYAKYPGGQLNATYNFIFADVRQFNFYAGPGAHTGFYNFRVYDAPESETPEHYTIQARFVLGISGQLGGEYVFKKIPLNISLDWRPAWSLIGNVFDPTSFCIGVRYRLL